MIKLILNLNSCKYSKGHKNANISSKPVVPLLYQFSIGETKLLIQSA